MAGRRCAEWRFPTAKQQRTEEVERRLSRHAAPISDEDAWLQAVLSDPRAVTSTLTPSRTLGEIQAAVLRVGCERCGRAIELRRDDAIARFGADAKWRQVGQRLLDDGCEMRSGQHEEDGCWSDFR
ncbi:hypothetical protein V1294_006058 [Bradyrhizobium sp. AZCC 1678]|uniref:hypothetical protein n=1 Tax=Bradyrhizobium sp. AZCC 1678 TaxID=3117030 RepID=UPI002FF05A57